MSFTGIPHDAADFYAELEQDNSTDFWQAHKDRYEARVRGPLTQLLEEVEEEFGPAKIFRPHRDVRFSADKSPYKTHQGGYVAAGTRSGWYAEVSADGFRLGGGCYHMDSAVLASYRSAVDGPRGRELEQIVARLRGSGWEVDGDQLKTAPRGWSREHERIGLLRHKTLSAMRWIEDADIVTTDALVEQVRADWRAVRPLVEWLRPVTAA
ncbi:DUF2461 domain-containing protein [Ornithinimicrobium cryptoxanthini]|uniref:DUF2461 domain-containing protein n=1 Tax=Ornithinimicrobium cryptoxanthini TaxID=2934161 RepID=A0ABY4YGJ8_9MICO|nr:DUF2461 domain-containing protein [Ornithinimicrobium cryptoxanthini]USQ75886.1 DUF2461 domain-containing protein [Ornithinimicrobium cryptoxanthini]